MKYNKLKDYEAWKQLNKEFTSKDFSKLEYLFGIITTLEINPDFLIIFSQLFYPNLILRDQMVFLESNFKEDYFNRLVAEDYEPQKIEYWLNLILVSSFFPDDTAYDDHAEFLCELLKKFILQKLESQFKSLKFKIISGYDEDDGYYITFHQ
ncbi:hypothetical protein ACWNT8_06785 [Pigmentibacter ruber]